MLYNVKMIRQYICNQMWRAALVLSRIKRYRDAIHVEGEKPNRTIGAEELLHILHIIVWYVNIFFLIVV